LSRGGYRYGAGRPAKRARVEDCGVLDVRRLRAAGGLRRGDCGALDIGAGQRIWYRTSSTNLTLHRELGKPAFQVVHLDSTAANLGVGVRWWIRCPACDQRRMRLFCAPAALMSFACRRCAPITYPSQRLGPFDRAGLRLQELRSKLGPNGEQPAGMIFRTYIRLKNAIVQAEVARDVAFIAMAEVTCPSLRRASPSSAET
jgi:hypothetical protein